VHGLKKMKHSARHAVIVGVDGQDGRLLREALELQGYSITGITRRGLSSTRSALPQNFCIANANQVRDLIDCLQPQEIYYLAAHHHSSEERPEDSLELLRNSFEVNTFYLAHFLQAIKDRSPRSRLFYACSNLIYGDDPVDEVQNEKTEFAPNSSYALSKLAGLFLCRQFANAGVFAATGILFNHESNWRSDRFISKKIVDAAVAAHRGEPAALRIGMLDAAADWGYAPDFVDAMQRILALDAPEEFVVATGVRRTVREFVGLAFRCVGLDPTPFVYEVPTLVKGRRVALVGDSRKLRSMTGWKPSMSFEDMVKVLVSKRLNE
jgi:GDPmannose 4,6-dehydratase